MRDYALMAMPIQEIGRALGCSGDEEQAAVLNAMGKEIQYVCRRQQDAEMQICYIAKYLDRHGVQFIKQLHEFILLGEFRNA